MGSVEISIKELPARGSFGSGAVRALTGFAAVIAVGTGLLLLPVADEPGRSTDFMEALFTAVSALCVTGLTVVETKDHWGPLGETVILALIQVGGLGYMMGTTVILWAIGRQLGLRDRQLLRLYYGAPSMSEALSFAKVIALYAILIEAIGITILYIEFVATGTPVREAGWWAIFHAISAFNNAGFNVTGNDMIAYRDDDIVLATISMLVIMGGVGAIPVLALVRRRSWARLSLDAKLIFITTGILLIFGWLALLVFEWNNLATEGGVAPRHRFVLAFFQSAMSRTAGFSAVPVEAMDDPSKFLTAGLMFIGGAAGSTAGGIKVGTFSLLFVAMVATFRGRNEAVVLGRRIPEHIVRQALVIALGFIAIVFGFTLFIDLAVEDEFMSVYFDTVSAIGTVGLSNGVPARAGDLGRLLFILAMMVGRFGPLVLVLEMNRQRRKSTYRVPEDSIRLG